MASLSNMSAEEISELLDDYGIKHGPVVGTTRSLYEKKLKEAMAKAKKEKRAKPSPDKTFYREEEESVTYVYRAPVRSDGAGDSGTYMRSRPEYAEREYDQEPSYSSYSKAKPAYGGRDYVNERYMYDTPTTYRNSSLKSTPMKPSQDAATAPKSSRLIPLWLQFVFFLAVAVFLYIVFTSMEANESFKGIE